MELYDELVEIIAEQLSVEKTEITKESKIAEDLGADSLDFVELTMALEEKFDVEIPDDEAENLTTVNSILEYIENL